MSKLSLRKAAENDAKFLFSLANETESRKNSFSQHTITSKEHEEWYNSIMHSANQKQYIFMDNDNPIGQGRINLYGKECCLSYSIIPERRGCGYGKILIYLLTMTAKKEFTSCIKCYGYVLKYNVASQKIFEELGFQCEIEETYFRYYIDLDEINSLSIPPPPPYPQQHTTHSLQLTYVNNSSNKLDTQLSYCPLPVQCGGILLLSNNRNSFSLYQWLLEQGEIVYFYSGRLSREQLLFLAPSLVISYNYSYIISSDLIQLSGNRIINLHTSLLPWNKGSDPNFWSFIENTPKGVTIHQLSPELDEGDIMLQEEIEFDETIETFKTTYDILNNRVIQLLKTHWKDIKEWRITPYRQSGTGSFHTKKQFTNLMQGNNPDWNETIYNFKKRMRAGIK